jgi:hypothetical protein
MLRCGTIPIHGGMEDQQCWILTMTAILFVGMVVFESLLIEEIPMLVH